MFLLQSDGNRSYHGTPVRQPKVPVPVPTPSIGTPQPSRQTASLLASLDKSILQIRDWLTLLVSSLLHIEQFDYILNSDAKFKTSSFLTEQLIFRGLNSHWQITMTFTDHYPENVSWHYRRINVALRGGRKPQLDYMWN